MRACAHAWVDAVCSLGGNTALAERSADELAARYAEPHRRYHGTAHVVAVLLDSAELADDLGLAARDCAIVTLAACAHDVCYDGKPGADERSSAEWARKPVARSGNRQD